MLLPLAFIYFENPMKFCPHQVIFPWSKVYTTDSGVLTFPNISVTWIPKRQQRLAAPSLGFALRVLTTLPNISILVSTWLQSFQDQGFFKCFQYPPWEVSLGMNLSKKSRHGFCYIVCLKVTQKILNIRAMLPVLTASVSTLSFPHSWWVLLTTQVCRGILVLSVAELWLV